MSNLFAGTGFYSQTFDTTVSGSAIRNALAELDGTAARGVAALTPLNHLPVFDLGTGGDIDLVAAAPRGGFAALQEALIGEFLVDCSSLSGTANLTLGPDAASNASRYIQFFNLNSTNDIRLLKFQVARLDAAAQQVNLGNTSGTTNNVAFTVDGATTGATGALIAASSTAGTQVKVEVVAENLTAGSEVVRFNVLTG